MRTFDDLARLCPYALRAASKSEVRTLLRSAAAAAYPPDAETPVGVNESLLITSYFSGDGVVFAMSPKPRLS